MSMLTVGEVEFVDSLLRAGWMFVEDLMSCVC